MKYQPGKVIKTIVVFLIILMAIPARASRYFSDDDQIMIQQWVARTGFKIYSTNPETQQNDRWQYTLTALQALHTCRPEQFYLYLSQLLISAGRTADDELNQLLQPALDLNKKEKNVFETFILEQSKDDLAVWLSHHTELEKHLARDDELYNKLFELLTRTTINNTRVCPEVLMLENFKGVKEKRHAVLQCIALSANLYIVDIDISHNRIATSKILGPGPVSTDLTSSPAVVLDNSEDLFAAIPDLYDNPHINPVILLTSPLEYGFLVSHRLSQQSNRPPISPLTTSDIEQMRQRYKADKSKRVKHEKKRHFLAEGKRNPHFLEGWIASPGYTFVACLVIAAIITQLTTTVPYPGNPWLGP
ncbi:hypothetical protein J7438_02050 [Thalassotalea sp. G20_0]|uniref:hypothetical protein n=1 Tax=Thalassotalea sp. G20_0 TaxID=2821093 RepID=UPI001AD9E73B|nr:hypothetical protein [Thalassotalea sp. G20_0]MBO9492877.1 hypothetical protein [Thalassotalea sp. G20_0]